MQPTNLCPQCGAHINLDTLECPFCKTVFKSIDLTSAKKIDSKKKTKLLLSPPENITDQMLVKKIMQATPHFQRGSKNLFAVLTMIIALLAIACAVLAFTYNATYGLIGAVICACFEIIFLVLAFRGQKSENENNIIKLIIKKDYEAAANLAKNKSDIVSCKIAYMLILYFRLSEYQLVKDLIFSFDLNKLTKHQYNLVEEVSSNFISKL